MSFFDSTTVEEDTSIGGNFKPIPEGDYKVIISRVDDKDTLAGGKMLAVTMQVIEGESKGRLLWHNFNYKNANPKAQLISEQQLKSICDAINTPKLNSPEELKDKPFTIHVKIKARTDKQKNVMKDDGGNTIFDSIMSYVVKDEVAHDVPYPVAAQAEEAVDPIDDTDIPF